jgi:endonuclease/exonuclease/phosphatase family metal-dependent hydrolase
VASYNTHRCVGIDRRYDPERIARVIRELDADIIGLQEIDAGFYRSQGSRQLQRLADATGLHVVSGPTKRGSGGHYGNVLLTSRKVVGVRRIDLSVYGREPRGAIDVDLDVDGEIVRVMVVHLGLGGFERGKQVNRLLNGCGSQEEHLHVVLGDFNEWFPLGRPLHRLHRHFGKSPSCRTFPSFLPVLALDRIWVKPLDALMEIGVHDTALSRVASDHLPIKATITRMNGMPASSGCSLGIK